MSASRIEALREIIAKDPTDTLGRFMLANELYKHGQYEETVEQLEAYLKIRQDEGAAYRILGESLVRLGRKKEARWAFRHGSAAARARDNTEMAREFEERLRELDKRPQMNHR